MARYPGARWRPVARYQPGGSACQPMARYDGAVDHTYVGSPSSDSAFAGFNTPGNAIPHFMVFRDGTVDQYVDTKFRSSACLDGNHRLIAWETADGFPGLWSNGQAPKDNAEMVMAKARLIVWLHRIHGIPLERMPSSKSTARGCGWHRLGIDGNFSQAPGQLHGGRVPGGERWSKSFGKTCPTERRIDQFVDETIPVAVKLSTPAPPPPPPPPKQPTPGPAAFEVSVMSGRFDRPDKAVAAAWQGERDHGSSVLLGTEVAGRDDATLIGDDDRFGNLHGAGAKGENAIQYALEDWEASASWLIQVWPGGGTGRFAHPVYARAAVLVNRHNGRTLVDIQNHDQAHLFKGSKFFNPENLVRWLKVRGRQARAMRHLRKQFPDAAFMLSGDPNADGTFLERYMAQHFKGFKAANDFKYGAVWVTGLRRVGPVESVKTPSSDHPIQRMTLRWEKKERKAKRGQEA